MGFTLRNGQAEGGGAILDESAEVALANCSFLNNAANATGWGPFCFLNASKVQVTDSIFEGNSVRARAAPANGAGAILALSTGMNFLWQPYHPKLYSVSPGTIALETATLFNSSVLFTNNRFEAERSVWWAVSCTTPPYPFPTMSWPLGRRRRHQR